MQFNNTEICSCLSGITNLGYIVNIFLKHFIKTLHEVTDLQQRNTQYLEVKVAYHNKTKTYRTLKQVNDNLEQLATN